MADCPHSGHTHDLKRVHDPSDFRYACIIACNELKKKLFFALQLD